MISGVAETDSGAAPAILLPADPDFRQGRDKAKKTGRIRWGAVLIAALFHAAILAVFLLDWSFALSPPPVVPPPIPVALVTEVPQPPPPPPQPTPPQKQALHELRSGPDQETTAPPQAEAKGPEAAPKPEPEPAPSRADALEPAPPKPAHLTPPTPPKPKEAMRETQPLPMPRGSVDRAPGETDRQGDPYLNQLWAMIERHRTYPAGAVGSLGLPLEGTVVFLVALTPNGAVQNMRLEHSSGAPILDDTARRMIEQAAPFPPLPTYFPHQGVVISVTIHLFPTAS